jgi:DNA-binding protein H-NS
MNLANMSLGELKKLQSAVEKEINGRNKLQRNKALEEIKTVAAKYGMKLSDVVGGSPAITKTRKSTQNLSAKSKMKSVLKEKTILYRHPEHPELTWGGGRGRRPQWIKDWEVSGRKLEEAKVSA